MSKVLSENGCRTITITDGTHSLSSGPESLGFSVNENDFYIDTDSNGNPKINLLFEDREIWSVDVQVPIEGLTLVLEQSAPYPYDVDRFTAALSSGEVNIEVAINDNPITGLSNKKVTTVENIFFSTGNNSVERGGKLTLEFFYLRSTPAGFGGTLIAERS